MPDSLQPLDRIVHISGVGEGSRDGVIGGTIELMHPASGRTLRVEKCVYVPQFPATVLNPVLLEKRGTALLHPASSYHPRWCGHRARSSAHTTNEQGLLQGLLQGFTPVMVYRAITRLVTDARAL